METPADTVKQDDSPNNGTDSKHTVTLNGRLETRSRCTAQPAPCSRTKIRETHTSNDANMKIAGPSTSAPESCATSQINEIEPITVSIRICRFRNLRYLCESTLNGDGLNTFDRDLIGLGRQVPLDRVQYSSGTFSEAIAVRTLVSIVKVMIRLRGALER